MGDWILDKVGYIHTDACLDGANPNKTLPSRKAKRFYDIGNNLGFGNIHHVFCRAISARAV